MSLILGIDPGRSGALALMDTSDLRVTCHDMPDTLAGLHSLIAGFPVIRCAIVEKPFYPAHVGTRAVAVMAENYGALKGALLWLDIPAFETRPSEWKAALGLSPDKAASRRRASEFFPADANQWTLAKHDGRAEAALIAWYGRKHA